MRALLPLALLLCPAVASAQRCTPSSDARRYRTAVTHRAPDHTAPSPISVATLMAWSPPSQVDDDDVRLSDATIDEREHRVATLEADLWRVKVGPDGCSLELELAAVRAGNDSPHVTAVVPAGAHYEPARAALFAALGRSPARARDHVDLADPLHVRLTGYVFWNGTHYCRDNPGRGCGHRTNVVAALWELHPVWRVEVVDGPTHQPPVEAAAEPTDDDDAPAPAHHHEHHHTHHEHHAHHDERHASAHRRHH